MSAGCRPTTTTTGRPRQRRRELIGPDGRRTLPPSAGSSPPSQRDAVAAPDPTPVTRRIQREPASTGYLSDPSGLSGLSFHLITLLSGRNTTVSNSLPARSAEGSTTIVPVESWRANTGKVPARNQFRAVRYDTPWPPHSDNYTESYNHKTTHFLHIPADSYRPRSSRSTRARGGS